MGHSIILPLPITFLSDQKGAVDDLEMNRVRLFGGGEDPEVRVHAMNPSQVTPSGVSPFGPTGPAYRVHTYIHSSLSLSLRIT